MATINAAAAKHVCTRGTFAALIVFVAGGLTGCAGSGGGSLLQTSNSPLAVGSAQTTQSASNSRARVAIAPVIGAPASIAKQIVSQLTTETAKNNITIAQSSSGQVDYTLRGYIVAARESSSTKVSYIWDVTNPTGARVHRITGEEVVKGAGAGDPWASVSPQLIQTIVAKTGQQLNTWMPQKAAAPKRKPSQPLLSAAPSNRKPQANANQVAINSTKPVGSSSISTAGIQPPSSVQSSGSSSSIGRPFAAVVPNVVGAPGDGSTALAAALRNELLRNGVKPAAPGVRTSYRVEGRVKMGPVQAGQQPIKIDWVVRDPKGASLGTVSQENKIPAGSLNGRWGTTAAAAATAATQGILKLLPKQTASR